MASDATRRESRVVCREEVEYSLFSAYVFNHHNHSSIRIREWQVALTRRESRVLCGEEGFFHTRDSRFITSGCV